MIIHSKVKVTEVKIVECDEITHANLEAEIHYPEKPGIVQVESFGIHLNKFLMILMMKLILTMRG